MASQSANDLITALKMQALEPEGGYWCPVYRSQHKDGMGQCACGSILYLVTPETFSHFHKLTVDEIFHFCAGDPVEQIIIAPDGTVRVTILGQDIAGHGESPVSVVPAGCWQAAKLVSGCEYALLSATTVPGYMDDCVTHASAEELAGQYPGNEMEILRFG